MTTSKRKPRQFNMALAEKDLRQLHSLAASEYMSSAEWVRDKIRVLYAALQNAKKGAPP